MPVPHAAGQLIPSMYHVESSDPQQELVDRSSVTPETLDSINRLMAAMASLRRAEEQLSVASTRHMKLNKTDMRALHFMMVSENQGVLVTPSALAAHLGISTASTTKLLDRLEQGTHITRAPHPTDRRALVVHVTAGTRVEAMNTMGRMQARRFHAATRLSPDEREVVIGFLEDTARELTLTDEAWAAPGGAQG